MYSAEAGPLSPLMAGEWVSGEWQKRGNIPTARILSVISVIDEVKREAKDGVLIGDAMRIKSLVNARKDDMI